MNEKYTPTTDDVRDNFCPSYKHLGWDPDPYSAHRYDDAANAAFDRWLAAHDAQVRADAWDEGFTEGRDLAVSGQPMTRNNPYKEQKQ